MFKKIMILFLLFITSQGLFGSSSTTASTQVSSIPVALSLNMGVLPMAGCSSSPKAPAIDCFIHRLGIAPFVASEAKIIEPAAGSYVLESYKMTSQNQMYYTRYHVNGYWASVSPSYTFTRFGSHQPLASVKGITKSGFNPSSYQYTAADYIIFCQNIITGADFSMAVEKVKTMMTAKSFFTRSF